LEDAEVVVVEATEDFQGCLAMMVVVEVAAVEANLELKEFLD
jgi:H+/Cl- antiporter ClcA